jgi:hypothetical protein
LTAARTTSVGRNRQKRTSASAATRSVVRTNPIPKPPVVHANAAIGEYRQDHDRADQAAATNEPW